jgi:peptidyl-tRNA hydrolase, PTH1 family
LIVGLGNPGQKYVGTRHNIGRDFIDHVAKKHNADFSKKRQAEVIRLPLFFDQELTKPVFFAKLDTFMNTSGPALQSLADKEGARLDEILIIVDEFMIPFGSLRLRPEGSAGGHNGLKSVIETFGSQEFSRLRVGVGPVPENIDPADFVLGRFTSAERSKMDDLYLALAGSLKNIFSNGMDKAMSLVNKAHLTL